MLKIAVVDAPSPGNLREYPHKTHIAKQLELLAYIFAADTMGLSSFTFLWWAPKHALFLQ